MELRALAEYTVGGKRVSRPVALLLQIAFGLACTGAAVLLRLALDLIAPAAGFFTLVYPTVLIATLYGTWRAGLATYVTGFLWVWYFILPARNLPEVAGATDASRLLVNGATVLVILLFAEIFRTAVRSAAAQRDRALQAVQERETHMRLALEAGRLGSWTLDVGSGSLATSALCREIFGRDPTEGFSYDELKAAVHPEDRDSMQAAVARAVAEHATYDVEYRILTPHGQQRWVQVRAELVLGDASGLALTGIAQDATARKHAAARRDALLTLSDATRELEHAADVEFAAARVLGTALDVSRVGYGTVDDHAGVLRVHRSWQAAGTQPLPETLPLQQAPALAVALRRGEAVVTTDVQDDPRTAAVAALFQRHAVVAAINIPVIEHGRLVAVLFVNNPRVRTWSGDDVALARDIAERTHATSERLRTAGALRDSEAHLRRANETLEANVEARTHELIQAQDALRQAQKMEAVGQLTGGIAHDFNNLLAGISGSLELLDARLAQGRYADVDRFIGAAQGATRRAAALTQRLLAFARRQTLDPRPTDVNRLISGMEDLLRRSVGPDVMVEVVGAGGLWTVKVDASQLENSLLNLCINARDAMAPQGGRITIETANKWLDEHAARERDLAPGQYVSLCVTDTGSGMTPEVMARAFDPFFTTKPLGEGTGLGLSMVYGFARQSGGQVRIYSELGKGTTMCLYFPRDAGEVDAGGETISEAADPGDGETVLVIDDEPTIRMLIVEVLEESSYRAIEASDGAAGLAILQSAVRIDLLVTDVGLPGGINGRQVADAARVARPGLKVLFITGFAENAVVGNGHLDVGMEVMTKPFVLSALRQKIRRLIDGGES